MTLPVDMTKIHLTTLYAIVVAIAPFLFWADGYIAHAEDVDRTNTQIMLEVQQIGVDNRIQYTDVRLDMYKEKELNYYQKQEYEALQQQRLQLMKQNSDLLKLKRQIK